MSRFGMGAKIRNAATAGAAMAVAATANLWPGITQETAQEFVRIGRGLPIKQANKFAQIHTRFYHRQLYPAAGSTTLTFFNAAASEHTTNLNNGTLPDDRPAWLTGIVVDFQDGAMDGSRTATIAQTGSGTTVLALDRAEQIRTILQAGLLQLFVADRQIHEAQNLMHYPTGGGFAVDAIQLSQASAAAGQNCVWNNGVPLASNVFKFPRPYPLLPGKQIKCLLKWPSLLTLTTSTALKVELLAEQVVPLNQ